MSDPLTALATVRKQLELYGCAVERVRKRDFYAQCPFCPAEDEATLHVSIGDRALVFYCHTDLHDSQELFTALCRELKLYEEELFFTEDVPGEAMKQWGNGATTGGDANAGVDANAGGGTSCLEETNAATARDNVPEAATGREGRHEVEQLLRAYEDGSLGADLPVVEAALLPDGASVPMQRIADLALRIVALKLWADRDDPYEVWLAYRFAAEWARLPEPTAYKAWRRLREIGWLILLREEERRPDQARGTFVFGIAGLPLPGGWVADEFASALPAPASAGESVDAPGVE